MRNAARYGSLLLILALPAAGCGSDTSRPPLTPSPAPQPVIPPQPAPIVLNGYVGDTAFRALPGARIDVLDGPQAGMSATADSTGQFSLTGLFDSGTKFSATLDGYVGATRSWTQCPTCVRPYLTFVLAVPTPPVVVPLGEYAVTFVADSSCADIPVELHTRTYTATMAAQAPSPNVPADTRFVLTLSDGTFLRDHNAISLGVAGNFISMWFGGDGPYVVEQVAPNTYLGFDGGVQAVATSPVQTIAATFTGWVDYCALNGPMGNYYDCPAVRAVARSECQSSNHQLIVRKR